MQPFKYLKKHSAFRKLMVSKFRLCVSLPADFYTQAEEKHKKKVSPVMES
jgi:hypothetical protein